MANRGRRHIDAVFDSVPIGRARTKRGSVGKADHLPVVVADEIGKVKRAHGGDPTTDLLDARRFFFEGSQPVQDVMGINRGDRGEIRAGRRPNDHELSPR
jgi:hypothetical protein